MRCKLLKRIAMILAFCLLNFGCSIFHPDKLAKEDGYYIRHFYSCGPNAIQDALWELEDDHVSLKGISKAIQDNGNGRRLALSLVHYNSLWITWPEELKKYFTDRGYTVTKTTIDKVSPEDTAIVLINGSTFKQEWHWVTYPTHTLESIKNFYSSKGRATRIIAVYIIGKAAE